MELSTNFTSSDFMTIRDVETVISHNDATTPVFTFNQPNSSFDQANIPLPGLTYTLFGLTCFFTILGLCGNFSILTIMLKLRNKSKGHDVLIIALAVFDSGALIQIALTQPCVYEVFGIDVRAITTV